MLPDVTSLDEYGGAFRNYSPVVDPTTDEDVKFRNRYAADVAAMTHTAPRALLRFTTVNGANPSDPTGFVHDAMWGSTLAVKPAVTRDNEGVWTAAYPTTVSDELTDEDPVIGGGVTHSLNFRAAMAQAAPVAGVMKNAMAEVSGPNTVKIYGFLANGTADDIPGAIITVVIW